MASRHEIKDALPDGPQRGRASRSSPANRFSPVSLHVLGEHIDAQTAALATPDEPDIGSPSATGTTVIPDRTRTLINYVSPKNSPDIGFTWSINPYRGCEHGCIYCYARPTHEYLGFNCGLDFETKIMAKLEAPQMLRHELGKPSWKGECIALSGVTDCYQPLERELKITRGCLEVMAQCRQPVGIVTKSKLVLRDLDLLGELARHQAVRVAISVTTLDAKLAAKMEPRASTPKDRLEAIRKLRQAGIPIIAMVAPIIPGINDQDIASILRAVADAGAQGAAYVLLRLPYQLKSLFMNWLDSHFPLRAAHIESLIRQTHGGRLYDSRPGIRQRGQGPVAQQINSMFKVFTHRYGLDQALPPLSSASFRRPGVPGQMSLF